MNISKNEPYSQLLTNRLMLPAIALLVGAGMTIVFWPGAGTWEVFQFDLQRKLHLINDWKSPFVAQIYWLADIVFNSTGPILLLQQALFWSGLFMVTRSTFVNRFPGVFFFLIVASLPPVWITQIMLWKEAWTMCFMMLCLGAIFTYIRTENRRYVVVAVVAATLMTATRHNALLLGLPAFYIAAQSIADKFSSPKSPKRRFIAISAFLIFIAITLSFNWAVNKKGKQRCHIWHHALLWDLAALSLSEGENLIPEAFRKEGKAGSLQRIWEYFTYYYSDPLFFAKRSPLILYGTATSPCDQQLPLDILLKSWLDAVRNHPGAYLHHRMTYMKYLFDIPDRSRDLRGRHYYRIDSEFNPKVNRSGVFVKLRKSRLYNLLLSEKILPGWSYMMVFFLSGLGLLGIKNREATWLRLVWFAGMAYLGSFIAIGSGAVMRYLTVYAVLGPVLLAGRLLVRHRSQSAGTPSLP
jgi:hypothetical protein